MDTPHERSERGSTVLKCCALLGVTILAYGPVLKAGFIWNDRDYVTAPTLRSLAGLARIWFEPGATEQYSPVLHSLFWVQHRLCGDWAPGYHLANVFLHVGCACLLAFVLRRLAVRGAWLAAFLFALHPVCVESVAWISEQKNTLSTFFFLLAAFVYLRFDRTGSRLMYVAATALFVLALLSKSVTATLPPVLLVIFWWRRGRIDWRHDILPLVPWFVFGAAAGLFCGWVERIYVGAHGADFDLDWLQRIGIAGQIVWFYIGKLVWPVHLVFIYPRWDPHFSFWQWIAPTGVVAVLLLLWWTRRRGMLAAALIYVGTLFPVLGFLNVYGFLYSFVADHWQYLSSMAVFSLTSAGIVQGMESAPAAARRWWRVGGVLVVVILGILSWRQTRPYADLRRFYEVIILKNPSAWMAHNNLGVELLHAGDPATASAYFRQALLLRPDYFEAANNLGLALGAMGRMEEAVEQFRRAVAIDGTYAAAHSNLGDALYSLGRLEEAQTAYRTAVILQSDQANAHYNLGVVRSARHQLTAAIASYERTLQLDPEHVGAHFNLGNALREANRADEAIVHFAAALKLRPDAEAHNNLGSVLLSVGRPKEALENFEAAMRLDPRMFAAQFNRAIALRRLGRLQEAQQQHDQAKFLQSKNTLPWDR